MGTKDAPRVAEARDEASQAAGAVSLQREPAASPKAHAKVAAPSLAPKQRILVNDSRGLDVMLARDNWMTFGIFRSKRPAIAGQGERAFRPSPNRIVTSGAGERKEGHAVVCIGADKTQEEMQIEIERWTAQSSKDDNSVETHVEAGPVAATGPRMANIPTAHAPPLRFSPQ